MSIYPAEKIRNIAIIAHVDHGKTTLVDALIRQTLHIRNLEQLGELIMDNLDQERERGITIKAKNASIYYKDYKINLVDTPGHADFGGEVERSLRMVDGVVLLVDAQEGPMPQTRFVLKKALSLDLKVVVAINKIDKPAANPSRTLAKIEDLFLDLGASDEQLNFPIVYTSGARGQAGRQPNQLKDHLFDLLEVIIETIPAPTVTPTLANTQNSLQILVLNLHYDQYKGKMGVGKISSGFIEKNQPIQAITEHGVSKGRATSILVFDGLGLQEVDRAEAGEIVMVAGLDNLNIGDTITTPEFNQALPRIKVDEPTIRMTFGVNTSPFAGREGKFTTSRQIRERLLKELETNVALRVEDHPQSSEKFIVSGRGELHLSVLIETMRREGFELEVSRPEVIFKEENGQKLEPFELVEITVPQDYQGVVMQELGRRGADIQNIQPNELGTEFTFIAIMPTRTLLGLKSYLLTAAKGTVIMHTTFEAYRPMAEVQLRTDHGSLVSTDTGVSNSYALSNAQERGVLFIGPGVEVYTGMVIGQNSRDTDLEINPCKGKKLTNVRSATADEGIILTPPKQMTLEQCLEYIGDDELVEVTPKNLRIRKKYLDPNERKKAMRN